QDEHGQRAEDYARDALREAEDGAERRRRQARQSVGQLLQLLGDVHLPRQVAEPPRLGPEPRDVVRDVRRELAHLPDERRRAERGRGCVVLERFDPGHAEGSSHGPTRIFRLAYHLPGYDRMALRAREAWRELESAWGTELLAVTGGIDIGPRAEEAAGALAAAGVDHEWLSAEEVTERW